ncbi:hypothetical protein DICPUDRAFT_147609 [Dictyostelium purpureum]|uniref:Uncharacterized protein n=1 Tax=Dictyostelium purpureum TaxID=5786 RepID=F0Z8Y3_DICPU|nr:uncharacterized protein DICPUDRAFT_147609 [Dictyostelium purpureum]EGC39542.1 hypothetical protein DICPUDRAFT_147609 [Dictyostelium purpureum]|eukprot:XP_003283877.1 hypothetical protein DICPUDRAFT_147609 [Dictyostelium purpureum]
MQTPTINPFRDDCDVAIVGLGLRLPGNSNRTSELWDNLLNGFDGIVETNERWSDTFNAMGEIASKEAGLLELEEWMNFDPLHFGINPAEAKQIDPQQRLLLKATWEAFEDAGIDPLTLRGTPTSVFVGASASDYSWSNTDPNEKLVNFNVFNSNLGSIANRVSYCFDFRGTSLTVDTACSSSLNACVLGYQSIINGNSDYSIVGGCNFILNPQISKAFTSINIIGKSGRCNVFDESADGFVRAEGVAVLILKKLSLAQADGDQIYAVIRGCNSNVDGTLNKGNFMKPSKTAQTNNIIKAFESTKGSLQYSDIDFFEVHGTGTPIGDPIEVEAVADVFKSVKTPDNPLLIGSIKSNIGHLEPASGVASLAKCCLMLKNRQFVKNIHFEKPNPNIKFEEWNVKVCTENTEFPNNKQVSVAINSFGITGSNVCILLTEYNSDINFTNQTNTKIGKKVLIPISANSKNSLKLLKEELKTNSILYSKSIDFKDFIYNQLYSKSTQLVQRSVFIASDFGDLNLETSSISSNSTISGNILKSNVKDNSSQTPLIYVMCGQGPQWNGQAIKLYIKEPIFKKSMDTINSILSKYFGYSILSKLRSIKDNDNNTINEPTVAQPSIFMLQVSLYDLYKHWDIKPSIILGHSFGEVSAAYCSGMITLETACEIIYQRSTLQNKTIGSGKMLAIGLNEQQFKDQFSSKYPTIEISCYNSPSSIVICGNESEVNEIGQTLKEKQVFSTLLGSPSSFHSSKQEVIKDEIIKLTKNIKSKKPNIPIFSTVTGELFKLEDSQFDSNYIYNNIRQPVLFQKAIENIFKYIESNELGNRVQFLELSPHPTLVNYIKEMIPSNSDYFQSQSIYVLSSLNRKTNKDMAEIRKSISQLYCNGYNVNFKCQLPKPKTFEKLNFKKASYLLPRYKWDDDIYFNQSPTYSTFKTNGASINQLGYKNEQSPFISYTSYIDVGEEPYKFLKGHQAKNKAILPGCAYLDNILKCFPNQDITINILEFKSPLMLIEGVKQCLSTNIYQSGKNEYRAVFHYKDIKTGKWILSAQGRFSITKHNTVPQKVNMNKYREKCNWTKLQKKELYEAIKEMAELNLTGSFQSIEEVFYGNDGAFLKISLNPPLSSYDNQSFLNICILDACFQSLAVYKKHPSLTVFDNIQRAQFFSENIPKSAMERDKYKYVYCYTEFIGTICDSFIARILMTLEDGTILFICPAATYTSITPTIDNFKFENPNNHLLSTVQQSKDSLLELPSTYLKKKLNELISSIDNRKAIVKFLYLNIKNNCQNNILLEDITSNSNEILISKYLKVSETDGTPKMNIANLFFEILKVNKLLLSDLYEEISILNTKDINTINNIVKILLNETPTPTEQDSSTLLTSFIPEIPHNQIIKEIITASITPIINEKIVFRILEVGSGIGLLSEIIATEINSLIEKNPLSEINIEFTTSDKENTFAQLLKEILLPIFELNNKSTKTLFKLIDLDQDLLDQKINPSYYDIIIITNLSDIQDKNSSIKNINQILYPNGYLIIIDTLFKPKTTDKELETYRQWLSSNCLNSTTNIDEWKQLLVTELGFKDFISTKSPQQLIVTAQKPSIMKISKDISKEDQFQSILESYDQIIIFGLYLDIIDSERGNDIEQGNNIFKIKSIEEFRKHAESTPLTEKSIIFSIDTINELKEENFKEITFGYIEINQHLLKTKCKSKHILVSRNAQHYPTNTLASSVIGAFRYFCEFSELNIYSFDFGSDIYDRGVKDFIIYNDLTNPTKHIQREYIIRGDHIFFEIIKKETNLKLKYESTSYIENKKDLIARLDGHTLEFKLEAKRIDLLENEIEIQVKAIGINFKDNLVYRGLVPKEAMSEKGDHNMPEIGYECSGAVTRIGNKVNKFKVGDKVLGLCFCSSSSHVIANQDRFVLKPKNISFVEAASIPLVYSTSYYSLFCRGNLNMDLNETVLIHSGTGGIGLACIELLKAMGFKSLLFVTVGSKEKEQYLRNTYGDFITGIYSSRSTDYVQKIKQKISEHKNIEISVFTELGVSELGVDVIINTLPVEFMEANFNALAQGGRIVDLSVTHLNSRETTDWTKFKYFISYSTCEVMQSGFNKAKPFLQIITDMIEKEKLSLIPIKEYPITNIKEAIEYISERKHIGKLVVNYESTPDLIQDTINKSNDEFEKSFLVPSPSYQVDINRFGKTILLTGQKGLSLTIIKWLLIYNSKKEEQAIKNIIVLSKSPIKHELEIIIGKARLKSNVKIYFKQVDISNKDQIDQIFEQLNKDPILDPIETIFHNAFIPVQSEAQEIDMQQLIDSHGAKTIGLINLYNAVCSKGLVLKNLVLASSIATTLGGHRQCGYVCANAVLDSFSKVLRKQGVPCISINFSPIEHGGYVHRNEGVQKLIQSQGLDLISTNLVIGTIDLVLQNQDHLNNKILAQFNHSSFNKTFKSNLLSYKLEFCVNSNQSSNDEYGDSDDELSIREKILNKFSEFLAIDPSKVNVDIPLRDYGIESMLVVELKNWLEKSFVPNILTISQLQITTISGLVVAVKNALNRSNNSNNSNNNSNNKKKTNQKKDQQQNNKTNIEWENEILFDKSTTLPTQKQIIEYKESILANNNENILLLTGATGYLGIYLLNNLIKKSSVKLVYCLVRNRTKDEAMKTIIQLLKEHQIFNKLSQHQINKIQIVVGDYSKDLFGIECSNEYTLLSEQVHMVVNCAMELHLKKNYIDLKESLNGVKQCIKFASHNKLKKIIQFSSLGMYSNIENIEGPYPDYYIPPATKESMECGIMNGYLQLKIVAEYHIKYASSKGVPSMIIRLPFLFSDTDTGIGRPIDLFQTFIQSSYLMSVYPKELQNKKMHTIPVSWASKTISFMIFNCWNLQTPFENLQCFNLPGDPMPLGDILESLEPNLAWRKLPSLQFVKKLAIYNNEQCKTLLPFISGQDFLRNIIINFPFKLSDQLKQMLISNNLNKGSGVTKQSILNHLSYTFKKKVF